MSLIITIGLMVGAALIGVGAGMWIILQIDRSAGPFK